MHDHAVIVMAMLTFRDGLPQDVRDYLPELVEKTRTEPGCVRYAPHLPLEGESALYFHEVWTDQGALDAHSASSHLATFRQLAAPHLACAPDVTLWRALG